MPWSSYARTGDLKIGGCSQAEVRRVVTEKYTEPPRAVLSDPATDDDTVQRDWMVVTTLQTKQARTITAGISTRQVAYLQPLHPDRHRVRVVGIIVLGNQHGIDGVAYSVIRPARTHQAPQILLVVRLADYFQIVTAVEKRNLEAIPYPGRSFIPAGCYRSFLLVRVLLRRRQAPMEIGRAILRDYLCWGRPRSAFTVPAA